MCLKQSQPKPMPMPMPTRMMTIAGVAIRLTTTMQSVLPPLHRLLLSRLTTTAPATLLLPHKCLLLQRKYRLRPRKCQLRQPNYPISLREQRKVGSPASLPLQLRPRKRFRSTWAPKVAMQVLLQACPLQACPLLVVSLLRCAHLYPLPEATQLRPRQAAQHRRWVPPRCCR